MKQNKELKSVRKILETIEDLEFKRMQIEREIDIKNYEVEYYTLESKITPDELKQLAMEVAIQKAKQYYFKGE